jgi:DNA topoisomerase-1
VVKGDKQGEKHDVTNLTLSNGKIKSSVKTETVGSEKGRLLPQDIGIIVTDFLTGNFEDIMNYNFTAEVEKDYDKIAKGELEWNSLIAQF